jgi:hypothetical protein
VIEAYGVEGTPYAFVIDKRGDVAARGGVNHIEHLEALIRQCHIQSGSDEEHVEIDTEPVERRVIPVVQRS